MASPQLLIDISAAVNQGAGIGRYSRELVSAAIPDLRDSFRLNLWYARDARTTPYLSDFAQKLPTDPSPTFTRSRFSRRRIDQLARMPVTIPAGMLSANGDLAYSPDFTLPGTFGGPSMVTVHDLAFEVIPEAYPAGLLAYLKHVVPINVRRSARVAVVSRTTRIDVVERYNIPADRVVVIPNAADQRFFAATPLGADRREGLGIPDDYLLAVGTIEPRKNYKTLLASQKMAWKATRRPLVIVGRAGWDNREEMSMLRAMQAEGSVIPLLDAEDADLPGLYSGARAVAYVPLYEGFGLPVLEAMASGAPVITSDIPSVKEIAAGFATIVDPHNADLLADAIRAVGEDDPGRIQARREAAARYSWQSSGTILTSTVRELAGLGND